MPAPKILDISEFGKREVTRAVEVRYETGETDLGRKIVSTREEIRPFVEVTPWFTLDEMKLCEAELGPLEWKQNEDGAWVATVDSGAARRRIFATDKDYKALMQSQKSAKSEKKSDSKA